MAGNSFDFAAFAEGRAPFRALKPDHFAALVAEVRYDNFVGGDTVLTIGEEVTGLSVVTGGTFQLRSAQEETLAELHAGDVFGHRAMLRDGKAPLGVVASGDGSLVTIPARIFHQITKEDAVFAAFFSRNANLPEGTTKSGPTTTDAVAMRLADIMSKNLVAIAPSGTIHDAASKMGERHVSCILILDDQSRLKGILTTGDLVRRVIAEGRSIDEPVSAIVSDHAMSIGPDATVLDAVVMMTENRIAHLPVTDKTGKALGIVTQTDLVRRNSNSLIYMINDIAKQETYEGLASIVKRKPQLLAELVGSGIEGHQIGRLMTGITDAVTKRLIALAEAKLGPAPVPYLWLACGSQGRQEQTGVSDQDNCLFLDNAYDEGKHGPYFTELAGFVSDGLDACGYFYCPGDMMATNPKWRQPVKVWKRYFENWIEKPDPMAQMLASVMFDLRPIVGDVSLFGSLHHDTLKKAGSDSIFRAHMISNSLKHTPPLGLFGGLSKIRDREHKNAIDLKHSGVVPITDLARAYALQGQIEVVNTRDRLVAARDMDGVLSRTGGADLIDAYDLIVDLRLEHQAAQIRASRKPDNFMLPDTLSALQRNHLKDAFSVVKTLQSAIGYGPGPR